MSLHSIRVSLLALFTAVLLTACGGSTTSTKPAPPVGGLSVVPGDSQVTISWQETPGIEYWIFASPNSPNLTLSNWLATTGSTYRLKVTSPFVVTGLTNGTPYSFFLTGRINSGPGGDATPTVTSTPRLAGVNWTSGTNLNTGSKTGLTYGNYVDTATNTLVYKYVAVGNNGRMFSGSDIATWSALTPAVTTDLNAVEFAFAKYIAVGAGGKIISSGDTQTWTQATGVNADNLNAISASGILVVAVGDNGTIVTSKDAITWTAATSVPAGTPNLYAVSYGISGKWTAVGANGTILNSDDGLTWTAQTSGTTADLKGIASNSTYVNGVNTYTYVVIGNALNGQGTVLSSPDAITWTAQTATTTASLNAISAINQFLVIGNNGTVITSLDGITWTRQTTNVIGNLKTLLRAENQYIAANDTGGLIWSK